MIWAKDKGNPGRCLRFDPTVLQIDKRKYLEAAPPRLEKPPGRKYQTVGAHEGVWLFSAPIEVGEKDRYFVIEADIKGPRSTQLFFPKVLIRGFQKVTEKEAGRNSSYFYQPHAGGPEYSEVFGEKKRETKAGDYLMVYRHTLVCRLVDNKRYHHFQMAVKLPGMKHFRPEVLLLKPYAMWPLGTYYFDNMVLRRVDKAEYKKVKAQPHSLKGFSALD